MSLGREINDFLNAFGKVENIATSRSKRNYYANKGSAYNPNNPPPGWGGGSYGASNPSLGRRITNAVGVTESGGPSVGRQVGSAIGGALGIGGGAGSSGGGTTPAGTTGYAPQGGSAYDPTQYLQTYAGGGTVIGNSEPYYETSDIPRPEYTPDPRGSAVDRIRALGRRDPEQSFPQSMPVNEQAPTAGSYPPPLSAGEEPPIPMPPAPPPNPSVPLDGQFSYPGAGAARAPVDLNAPVRQPAVGGAPARPASRPPSPAARKALGDQTRTEAYNPDLDGPTAALPGQQYGPPASATPAVGAARAAPTPQTGDMAGNRAAGQSTNNAGHDLEAAINGGLRFAQKIFHLDGSGVAVGGDPRGQGGAKALFGGVGAAPPQLVQALDQKVNQGVPQGPNAEQLYAIRRLEAIYTWRSANGDKAGADKAAFELMQYSAGVAAKLGMQAVEQYKGGDVQGAQNTVIEAYNQIPDGRHLTVQGSTATVVDTRTGKAVQSFQFTPEQVLNAALGLGNRSLYWQTLAQRVASSGSKASNRTDSQQELDRARADYYRARTGQVGKSKAGGGRAAPAGPSGNTQAIIEQLNAVPRPGGAPALAPPQVPQDNTPPQGDAVSDGGDDDDEERALNADPSLKANSNAPVAPASVLRVKPPQPGSGAEPAPSPAPTPAPPSTPAVPNSAASGKPGRIAGGSSDPDTVPPQVITRNGDRYEPVGGPGAPKPFDEEKPAGIPKELLAAQAAAVKLTNKEGGPAVRQHIAQRIKEWNDYNKGYATREKEWKTNERKRVDQEYKDLTAKQKAEAKATYDLQLKPLDRAKLSEAVGAAWDASVEQAKTVAKEQGTDAFEKSIYADPKVDPTRIKSLAANIMTSNPNPDPATAVRMVYDLTRIDPNDATQRRYRPVGKDVLGNVVLSTQFGPVHVRPEAFMELTSIVKDRLSRAATAGKEGALKAVIDAEGPTTGKIADKVTTAVGNRAKSIAERATTVKKPEGTTLVDDIMQFVPKGGDSSRLEEIARRNRPPYSGVPSGER